MAPDQDAALEQRLRTDLNNQRPDRRWWGDFWIGFLLGGVFFSSVALGAYHLLEWWWGANG